MAFNGTRHFPKQDVVAFLQSTGMRFGAHINANTSFDQTVYQLQIPTDSPAVIDRSLLILEDWAHAVSFDPDEIDKERGVILEEWRIGLGAGARMLDAQLPVLLKDSRYAERLPIGKPEIIRTFHLRSAEEVLHRLVSARPHGGDRRRRLRPGRDRGAHQVALRRDPGRRVAAAAADLRRARSAGHALHRRHRPRSDRDDGQRVEHDGGARSDDDRRLPAADDRAGVQRPAVRAPRGDGAEAGRAVPRRGDQPRPLRAIGRGDDAERAGRGRRRRARPGGAVHRSRPRRAVRLHADRAGPLSPQLSCRPSSSSPRRTTSTPRQSLADEYIRNFMQQEPIPGIAYENGLVQRFLPEITLADVNSLARDWMPDRNRVVVVSAPKKAGRGRARRGGAGGGRSRAPAAAR